MSHPEKTVLDHSSPVSQLAKVLIQKVPGSHPPVVSQISGVNTTDAPSIQRGSLCPSLRPKKHLEDPQYLGMAGICGMASSFQRKWDPIYAPDQGIAATFFRKQEHPGRLCNFCENWLFFFEYPSPPPLPGGSCLFGPKGSFHWDGSKYRITIKTKKISFG